MSEERTTDVIETLQAVNAMMQADTQPLEKLKRGVGQSGPVQIGPEQFYRIELRRVGGEPLGAKPTLVLADKALDHLALVCRQAIHEQDYGLPSVSPQGLEKPYHTELVNAPLVNRQEPTQPVATRGSQKGHDAGERLPIERLNNQRRLPLGGPSGTNGRTLGKARFVQKTQPSVQFSSVFFTCGQRTLTQCAIASSFLSFAFFVGRWRLQPRDFKMRQTWCGW